MNELKKELFQHQELFNEALQSSQFFREVTSVATGIRCFDDLQKDHVRIACQSKDYILFFAKEINDPCEPGIVVMSAFYDGYKGKVEINKDTLPQQAINQMQQLLNQ